MSNDTFNDNVRTKIHFLCNNINNISCEKDKQKAKALINKCCEILSRSAIML